MHRATLTLVVVLAATLASLAAPPAEARSSEDRLERLARAKINSLRASNGRRKLRVSKGLARSAGKYARWMLRADYFGHLASIRAPSRYRSVGEIIMLQRGGRVRPQAAVRAWARSSAHRYIMLERAFGVVGVGKASGRFRGRQVTVWVTHVGRR